MTRYLADDTAEAESMTVVGIADEAVPVAVEREHNCCIRHNEIYTLLLVLKKVGSARLRESDIHPISPKTPAPQYQPIDKKKRKGKRVEDYSRDRAA